MNSNPKQGKRGRGREYWLRVAMLAAVLGCVVTVVRLSRAGNGDLTPFRAGNVLLRCAVNSSVILAVLSVLTGFIPILIQQLCVFGSWFFSWRILKRIGLAAAILLSLIVLFHIEEDRRGWRAWETCRRECEARGQHLDFEHFIPAPVPDDRNFAMAPVVASSWAGVLDKNGHNLRPSDTNVVNRLDLTLDRALVGSTTNMLLQRWKNAQAVDLRAWQDYFRTMVVTNRLDEWVTADAESTPKVTVITLTPNEYPMTHEPQTPAEDVLLALSKYGPVLEELRQASKLPHVRFPLNYNAEQPWEIEFPPQSAISKTRRVLILRAVAELSCGRTADALSNIELSVFISEAFRAIPVLIGLRPRALGVEQCLQPIWEGLASRCWSDDQLRALDRTLNLFNAVEEYDLVLQAELAAELKQIDYLRKFRRGYWIPDIRGGYPLWPCIALIYAPDGWFDLAKRSAVRVLNSARPNPDEQEHRILSPESLRRSRTSYDSECKHSFGKLDLVYGLVQVPQDSNLMPWARTQAYIDMARIACALERYYLEHHSYPRTLDLLVPGLMDRVPNDIITGQPLHYAQSGNGRYVLYSVGWNKKDDGGLTESRQAWFLPDGSSTPGDWVWRYPEL